MRTPSLRAINPFCSRLGAAEFCGRVEAWRCRQRFTTAEQSRWADLMGSKVKADALSIDSFGDNDLDAHPFNALGGYVQGR